MGAAADAGVADQTVRAHGDAVADHHVAHQHGVDVEGDVLAALQISTDIQAGGIEQGDAGAHQRFRADPLIDPFQARQLHPVVDAVHFPGVAGLLGNHLHARVHGHGDQVGEVVFALGVAVGESRQAVVQEAAGAGENAGIDFADRFFVVAGVFLLHHPPYLAVAVANHTAVAGGVIQSQGHQRQALVVHAGDEVTQGLRLDQRHVAVQHQHHVFFQVRQGLRHGVAGAELFGLLRPLQPRTGHRLADGIAAVTVNQHGVVRIEGAGGVHHVLHHGAPGNRVEYLGEIRFHAGSLARRENHYRQIHAPLP